MSRNPQDLPVLSRLDQKGKWMRQTARTGKAEFEEAEIVLESRGRDVDVLTLVSRSQIDSTDAMRA